MAWLTGQQGAPNGATPPPGYLPSTYGLAGSGWGSVPYSSAPPAQVAPTPQANPPQTFGDTLSSMGFHLPIDSQGLFDKPLTGVMKPDNLNPNALQRSLPWLSYNLGANSPAFDAIQGRALSADLSPWAQAARARQGLEETSAVDLANAQANSGAAAARSTLARRGALRGGATERLARGAAQDALMGAQDARRTGILARAGIDIADQEQKNRLLANAGQLENSRNALLANAFQGDTDTWNKVLQYNNMMDQQAWAAAQSANAMRDANSFDPFSGVLSAGMMALPFFL